MKKTLKKLLSVAIAAAFAIGLVPASPDVAKAATTSTNAYLSYGNSDWSVAYNGATGSNIAGSTGVDATVTGAGTYTVSMDMSKIANPAGDVAFLGLIIDKGDTLFPNYTIKLTDVQLNGKSVTPAKGYTNDESGATRMNLCNTYVSSVPTDEKSNARSYDGSLDKATWAVLTPDQLKDVKTLSVTFEYVKFVDPNATTAILSYGNSDWSVSYNGATGSNIAGSTGVDATVTGAGKYTVSMDLSNIANPAGDVAFLGLIIDRGDTLFPNYTIKLTDVQLNGKAYTPAKGYTNDESAATRMNLCNTYVSSVPTDEKSNARSFDGSLDKATWAVISAADLKDVKTLSVSFEYIKAATATPEKVKLSVSKTKATVAAGKSVSLTYKATDLKAVTVKTSNKKVATVKKTANGKIKITVAKTAKKGAKATITLTSGKEKVTVKVTVK